MAPLAKSAELLCGCWHSSPVCSHPCVWHSLIQMLPVALHENPPAVLCPRRQGRGTVGGLFLTSAVMQTGSGWAPLCSCSQGTSLPSPHSSLPAPLSSLLPTLAAGTKCSQAPTAMPGACQVHMLLSLPHTFPKGKKIHSLEIHFSVHSSSSRKNRPG